MNLEIENLTKSFGTIGVLEDINFSFTSGKIYGLIGKNGAGKTTFFNCLNGNVGKDSGSATLCHHKGEKEILKQRDVGFIESTPVLPEFLTGIEFIKILVDVQGGIINNTIEELFDIVELNPEEQKRLIKNYSHGMKNKLQMLSLFICNSPVWFLDEPLTSLDIVVAAEIKKIIRKMKKDHIIILSTHILQLAQELCDELVVLNNKKLTRVEQEMLQDKEFEEAIMNLLKDDESIKG